MNNKILKLRQALQELIAKEDNLLDPKVIAASQELDEALNDYNKLLKELNKQSKKRGRNVIIPPSRNYKLSTYIILKWL